PGQINRFVWQTAGRETYQKLLGVYVTPPSWAVRFARFKGDVAARAEEYEVDIEGSGKVFRQSHVLPEGKPGKNLTEADARVIAVEALGQAQPHDIDDNPRLEDIFKEVSAQASRRPSRTDWTFVFKDLRDYGLSQGEARISIDIAGDEVVS